MAITNAQQYQQLVNKPADGKRPGYRGDAAAKAAEKREAEGYGKSTRAATTDRSDPGESDTPGFNPDTGRFEKPDPSGPPGTTIPEPPRTPKEVQQDLRRAVNRGAFRQKNFFNNIFPVATNFVDSIGRTKLARINNAIQRQNYIDSLDLNDPEQKAEYDRVMNELGGLGIDIIAGPETLTDTSLKQPMSLGAPKTTFKTTSSFDDDVSALGDPDVKEILGEGYEEYLNRFNTEPPPSGDDTPIDPCKGPNPPAYCFIDPPTDPTDPSTPSTGVFAGIAPRFAGSIFDFDALRAGAMDGGIMNNKVMGGIADGNIDEAGRQMYFLGKLVKKATRAVKKVVKSPFGKAALLGLGAYGLGGGFGAGKFKFGNFTKPGGFLSKILTKGGDKALSFDNLSVGKATALGLGIPFALDMLGVGKDDDDKMDLDEYYRTQGINVADIRLNPYNYLAPRFRGTAADGGLMRMGYQEGGDAEPVAKKTMPLIDMDGQEKDYRETGGFVDMGRMERADDVPARLSKNEFVFTADAVRNAGEGDIDKGAEVMYNMMKNLEAGGEVSEESQGLEGARNMFQTSQRLGEVL